MQLVGRDEIIEKSSIALDRCRNGRAFRGLMLVGLRGVGKTVLLRKIETEAEANGLIVVHIEAPEQRSLPAMLIPALRAAMIKLDRLAAATERGKQALRALAGFIGAMKLKFHDVEVAIDIDAEKGVADSGDLEYDLISLLLAVGHAAKERQTAVLLAIDEIQYIEEEQFAALIMALHRCTQEQLPVILIGAGLPQLVGQAGRAKSYAERLFEYPEIGPLTPAAARMSLVAPARTLNVDYTPEALEEILRHTKGYPYFLQEWGKHSWDRATQSPITYANVADATELAIVELDASFFRVRFDRLTPSEKRYLRAMAELGAGPHRSGEIAQMLQKTVRSVAPTRAHLIRKGMIYSQDHGETSFTVPLFHEFMKRIMPVWRTESSL